MSALAQVMLIRRGLVSLDVDVPPAIQAGHDRHDRTTAAMKKLTRDHAQTASLVASVVDAFENNTDPVSDPDIQRLLVAERIADHVRSVPEFSAQRLEDTYRDHADDLIAALRGPFDTAARDLAEAHGVLGDVDLDDTAAIVRRGAAATEAWGDATTAATAVGIALDAWRHLYLLATRRPLDARYRPLILADISAAYVDADVDHEVDAWTAVCNGWELSLPTHDGYQARVDAVATERESRAAAAAQALKDARPDWSPRVATVTT